MPSVTSNDIDVALPSSRTPDGIMVAPGSVGRYFLAGFDVDTCLSEINGVPELADWAKPYLDLLKNTYTEVSPSLTGAKAFFFIRGLAIKEVERAFGFKENKVGRKITIKETGAPHPPAVELHYDRRFFALTKHYWTESADQISVLEVPILQQIAALLSQGVRDPGLRRHDRQSHAVPRTECRCRRGL